MFYVWCDKKRQVSICRNLSFFYVVIGTCVLDTLTVSYTIPITNITALTVYWMDGKVLFLLGLTAGAFSVAGNWLGARFFENRGARAVKPIMLTVLAIFFIRVLLEQLGLLV